MLSVRTCGTRLLGSRREAVILSGGVVLSRASSSHRGRSGSGQHDEQWKNVYRDFILQVHPDFFQGFPEERAVNQKSLMTLSQHLERLQLGHAFASAGTASSPPPLVFFVKQAGGSENDSGVGVDGAASAPSPRRFLLPLESRHQLHAHLQLAGITSIPPVEPSSPRQQATEQAQQHASNTGRPNNDPGWHTWGDHTFGGTAANRAWGGGDAGGGGARKGTNGRSAFTSDEDRTREGRQRTTEWGAAFEGKKSGGASRLGQVLATDEGRALVRERQASSRNVRRLVDELRQQYGFGVFTFRCGWSKANLCKALDSLLETCHGHRKSFKVADFGGLEVVFRNAPSALHKGEIRFCPADVPNQWVAVLQHVTPDLLLRTREDSQEMLSLQGRASSALQGARLSRGLSCSRRRYREFLERLCVSDADVQADGGDVGTDGSLGDWSELRCRVEEGFSRVSKVLEDGTIQVGSEVTLAALRQQLERDFAAAAAATGESLKLAAAAAALADRCRQSLGLVAVNRVHHAVSLAQLVVACEALVELGEGSYRGELGAEAVAARRRLRGHRVMVVGSRVGVCDGLTEDGEIVVPWNWAEEEGVRGEAGEGERRSSAPFY